MPNTQPKLASLRSSHHPNKHKSGLTAAAPNMLSKYQNTSNNIWLTYINTEVEEAMTVPNASSRYVVSNNQSKSKETDDQKGVSLSLSTDVWAMGMTTASCGH